MKNYLFPLLQTILVGLVVLSFYAASWFGDQFVLRAEPYDPFDPFYGEYVLLQYPDLKPAEPVQNGDVYFTLKESADGYAMLEQVSNKPFFGAIHGSYYGDTLTAPQLEQYYVEQGTGPGLEKAQKLAVTVDVAPWGTIRPVFLEARQQ
ncbi:GDYXXLXY domain-containing protein [Planococcus shenhongbingii]|uniref:GDYXXLXY domain-containing protein n=1 Tax=Planococcus shenhongbingii TaxID=3058398 RepID=A0ABT8NG75_9BACL|nr:MULTISPECIES: GDYXXLXY domain-containing protein [unclassified Planococcus (in: firmicutes)]MDN7246885.1 GDYXXLXY domain-containing protein [Planococcus sp. N017]WKA58764.1 GDYXXLXY domain-containing protein [Planococcus sp. N016]